MKFVNLKVRNVDGQTYLNNEALAKSRGEKLKWFLGWFILIFFRFWVKCMRCLYGGRAGRIRTRDNSTLAPKPILRPKIDQDSSARSWRRTGQLSVDTSRLWRVALLLLYQPLVLRIRQRRPLAYAENRRLIEQQESDLALFEAATQFMPLSCHLAVETWLWQVQRWHRCWMYNCGMWDLWKWGGRQMTEMARGMVKCCGSRSLSSPALLLAMAFIGFWIVPNKGSAMSFEAPTFRSVGHYGASELIFVDPTKLEARKNFEAPPAAQNIRKRFAVPLPWATGHGCELHRWQAGGDVPSLTIWSRRLCIIFPFRTMAREAVSQAMSQRDKLSRFRPFISSTNGFLIDLDEKAESQGTWRWLGQGSLDHRSQCIGQRYLDNDWRLRHDSSSSQEADYDGWSQILRPRGAASHAFLCWSKSRFWEQHCWDEVQSYPKVSNGTTLLRCDQGSKISKVTIRYLWIALNIGHISAVLFNVRKTNCTACCTSLPLSLCDQNSLFECTTAVVTITDKLGMLQAWMGAKPLPRNWSTEWLFPWSSKGSWLDGLLPPSFSDSPNPVPGFLTRP